MPTGKDAVALRRLGALFNIGAIGGLTDGQLLERFATGPHEAAELAFAALVERHGPMVLRTCRALLGDPHDAEDAFQATFVVLVRRGRLLSVYDSLGPWLHQVAARTALCARSAAARRRKHEARKAEQSRHDEPHSDGAGAEMVRALYEEIGRLPRHYQASIVLCDLEGHTCEEAARRLGRPVGTVKCWRSRGRERLRRRLTGRGLAPSAGLASLLTGAAADAAVPRHLADEAARCAVRVLAGSPIAAVVPASVSTLVKGVFAMMLVGTLRTAAIAIFALALLAAGAAAARVSAEPPGAEAGRPPGEASRSVPDDRRPRNAAAASKDGETWELTLREAIRIGLDNADIVRVTEFPPDGGCAITPANPEAAPQRFRADAMAFLRSIENQYWTLAQQHGRLRASERASETAREILDHFRAERRAGRRAGAEVIWAEQRAEQFALETIAKKSELTATDRQFRERLGLPRSERREIVPVTTPTSSLIEPDWEQCLSAMLEKHPDIVEAKAGLASVDVARQGVTGLEQKRAKLREVIHDLTHDLARCFLTLDATYKNFKAASERRASADQKVKTERTAFAEGHLTLDQYLEVVAQRAAASALEEQMRAEYNKSIPALEEAKGTLLEYDLITVADEPPAQARGRARVPRRASSPVGPGGAEDAARGSAAMNRKAGAPPVAAEGRTFSFDLTLSAPSGPLSIRGSFTVGPASPKQAEGPFAPAPTHTEHRSRSGKPSAGHR